MGVVAVEGADRGCAGRGGLCAQKGPRVNFSGPFALPALRDAR